MKTNQPNTMLILALGGLLATPPAVLHSTSHIHRSIASVALEDVKLQDEKLEVKIPDLRRSEILVADEKQIDFKIEHQDLPAVALPDLQESDFQSDAKDDQEVKHQKISDIALPYFKKGELKMSHPRLNKLVLAAKDKKVTQDVKVDLKKFVSKRSSLVKKLAELKEDKTATKEEIESAVIDVLLVENALENLKPISKTQKDTSLSIIADAKDDLELLLLELESPSETKVAKSKKAAKVESEEEDEKSDEACDKDEKISVLSKQVDKLLEDQNKIMQSMLSMSQMMMMNMMMQQQQMMQNPMQNNYPNQSAYQYQQPQTAGNWVYYPQGFQPGQSNIFQQQPQLTQYPTGQYQGPTQQSSWGMAPSMNLNTSSMITPGTFGGDGMSFNFSNSVPTISQR